MSKEMKKLVIQDEEFEVVDAVARLGIGSPLVASTVASMTDQTKIYVYTGSETGYTSGHWYYYNGSAWTDGGVYNSVGYNTDTTLSTSNMAADAKVTGLKLQQLNNEFDLSLVIAELANGTPNNVGNMYAVRNTNRIPVKFGDVITIKTDRPVTSGNRYVFAKRLYNSSNTSIETIQYGPTQTDPVYVVTKSNADHFEFGISEYDSSDLNKQLRTTSFVGYSVWVEIYNIYSQKLTIQNESISIPKTKLGIGSLQSQTLYFDPVYIYGTGYNTLIPVSAGELVEIDVPELENVFYKYRFGWYKADKTYLSQIALSSLGVNIATVPSDCAYFVFCVYAFDANGDALSDYHLYNHLPDTGINVVFNDRFKTTYTNKKDVQEMIDDFNNSTDIVSLNKDVYQKLLQAKRPLNLTSNAYLSAVKPLVLMHFSDIHGDASELYRMVDFKSQYDTLIDDVICTGDIIAGRWSDDFTYWDAVDGAENIMIAIGNHDVLTASSGWDWSQRASEADQYNRYFAPFISNWDVTSESGKTYYYKDYTENEIRLIVLNCMLTGDDDTDQQTWFNAALNGAKTNGYSVIVASHYMIANTEKINCNFTNIDKSVGVDVLPLVYLTAVQDFIDADGKFICYIAGHTHLDYVVKSTTYPDQICIVVDALSRSQGNQYSDTQRTDGTKSQDLANIIAFDTSSNVVKIIRVGANIDHYLKQKNCLTINYLTGDIVAQN